MASYLELPPRSFIGWSATLAYCARGLNDIGQHQQAKALCERTLAQLSDAHREYVTLFLMLDLQLAAADAGLKDFASALARIDGLRKRFAACEHPLLHGSLHEARARICWAAGDAAGYEQSRALMEFHFRSTQTPALIAKCEQLAQLPRAPSPTTRHPSANDNEEEHETTELPEALRQKMQRSGA